MAWIYEGRHTPKGKVPPKEEQEEKKPIGPPTKSGRFYSKRQEPEEEPVSEEPSPEEEIDKVDERVGKFYTIPAYQQFREKQFHKGVEVEQSIDPFGQYEYEGGIIPGNVLRAKIHREYTEPSRIAWEESLKLKSGTLEIFRGYDGFEFRELKASDSPSLSGFGSYLLNIGDYAFSSITGKTKTYDPLGSTYKQTSIFESPAMKESRLLSHQRDIVAWEKGDIGYFGGKILSNPYTTAFISMGFGAGSTILGHSRWGAKAFMGSNLVSRGTAVQSFMGGASTGYLAGMGSRVYSEQGISGLRSYVGRTALSFPAIIGGYNVGQSYGYSLVGRGSGLLDTYRSVYAEYMPKKLQSVFGQAKQHVVNPMDIAWTNRQWGKISQNLIPPRYRTSWYQTRLSYRMFKQGTGHRIHTGSKIFARDMGYYGTKLYPHAVRSGLVKDVGLFSEYEVGIPYPGYSTAMGFKWPERDISIMPHKIPTRTWTFMTGKGIRMVSMAEDYSSIGRFDVTPFTKGFETVIGGKKGGIIRGIGASDEMIMRVIGESFSKQYTRSSGPYGIIPSIRKTNIFGIIRSTDIKTPYSGDFGFIRSSGEFYVSPYKPSPGGSYPMNVFTETISGIKYFESNIRVPGRYGFETIETPKMELAYTFGRYYGTKGYGYIKDVGLSLYPKPKTSNVWESFGGGGKTGYVGTSDLVMPGGAGISIKDTGMSNLLRNTFSGLSNLHRTGRINIRSPMNWESQSYISGYWTGIRPQKDMSKLNLFKTLQIPSNITDFKISTDQTNNLSNINKKLSENINRAGLISIGKPISKTATRSNAMTTNIPAITVTKPVPPISSPHPFPIGGPIIPLPFLEDESSSKRKKKGFSFGLESAYKFRLFNLNTPKYVSPFKPKKKKKGIKITF